jgi:hypothetical protein
MLEQALQPTMKYTFNVPSIKYIDLNDLFDLVPAFYDVEQLSPKEFLSMIQYCSYKT